MSYCPLMNRHLPEWGLSAENHQRLARTRSSRAYDLGVLAWGDDPSSSV
jgi:hypothetical protein